MVRNLCLFLLLLSTYLNAQAQQDLIIKLEDNHNNSFKINYELYLLKDSNSNISFDMALECNRFELYKKSITPNLGFTQNNYWVKFTIANTQAKQSRVLEFAYPFYNQLDVYIPDYSGKYKEITVGDHFPFAARPLLHKNFLFDLNFESGETKIIYAYIHCNGEATSIPINIWTKHNYLRSNYEEHLALGIYYGIIFFVLFFSVFLWAIVRERSQFYYLFYIIGVAIFQFALDGFAFEYIWPNNIWLANHIIPISGSFTLMTIILFVQSLLDTKTNTPKLHRILLFFLGIDVILFAMSFFENPFYSISLIGINFIAVPINLLILVIAIISYRIGHPSAKYFLVAFTLLILGLIAALLKNFGVLPRVFLTEYGIQIGSAIELIMLSLALAENMKQLKADKEIAQALLLEELQEKNRMQELANIELENRVHERTTEIQLQKELIEEKNKDITDSINYAQKIQEAILPRHEEIQANLQEHFIFYRPRDIVSGDFYWFSKRDKTIFLAVADCTGHGVPGALMSMLGNSFLNEIVNEYHVYDPAEILDLLRLKVIKTLRQKETLSKDGMDIALISLNLETMELKYSGAFNPIFIVTSATNTEHSFDGYTIPLLDDIQLLSLPGDRFPVGIVEDRQNDLFKTKTYNCKKDDCIYLFTDGVVDQFGGEKGKKFKTKQLKEVLLKMSKFDMDLQYLKINDTFDSWKGEFEQVDDVLLIGIKIG